MQQKARDLPPGLELGSEWSYREFTTFPAGISRQVVQLLYLAQTHVELGELTRHRPGA